MDWGKRLMGDGEAVGNNLVEDLCPGAGKEDLGGWQEGSGAIDLVFMRQSQGRCVEDGGKSL